MSGICAKVDPNGQLVIPENVTSSLDWLPGAKVTFSVEDNRLVARKSHAKAIPFFYALAMRSIEDMKSRIAQSEKQRPN